eukprot:jgi/Chrzof1/4098/Cz13g20090.t1
MLEQQLDKTQSKLGTTRQNMGGIFSAKEKSQALQKQIKILENRLEKNYIKYNEAITYNKQLREQIDNLRQCRIAKLAGRIGYHCWLHQIQLD